MVERARTQEDALKYELASDRVAASTFRDMFLTYNKPWLQGQLHEVFTPRTLFLYRKEIIEQFRAVMDDIAPDISFSEDHKSESEEQSEVTDSDSSLEEKSRRGGRTGRRHKMDDGDQLSTSKLLTSGRPATKEDLARLRQRLNASTAAIARYWLTRSRFVATLRVQVQSVIDLRIEEACTFCGTTEYLTAELLQDLEALFHEFLVNTGEN